MASPLPALSSYSPSVALKEQLWEQRAGGLGEDSEEGLWEKGGRVPVW